MPISGRNALVRFFIQLLAATTVCHVLAAHGADSVKIGGIGAALSSMRLLGTVFEGSNPDIKISVLPSLGTGGAVKAVAQGLIDIGLAGRPLNAEERKLGLAVTEFGKTPLVFVVRPDVAKSNLTTADLVAILNAPVPRWPDGKRIRLVLRSVEDAETISLRADSPALGKALDTALSRPGRLTGWTAQEAADLMESTPGSLGYATLSLIVGEKRALTALAYNGVAPGVASVADGSYPFQMILGMASQVEPSPAAKRFMAFVRSAEGTRILKESGIHALNSPIGR